MSADITSQYKKIIDDCNSTCETLKEELRDLFRKHPEIDLHDITKRVKKQSSIERKMSERKNINGIEDCEDLVGLRVICHCISDVNDARSILKAFLKRRCGKVGYELKEVERSGYKADHFTFKDKEKGINCEIQLKTVLRDAWAVQSRHYLYGKKQEGDSDKLSKVVAGILENCEHLWELVKQNSLDEGDDESTIASTPSTEDDSQNSFIDVIEDAIEASREVKLKGLIDDEIDKIKLAWAHSSNSEMQERFETMEMSMKRLTILGLMLIKHDKAQIFTELLESLPEIAAFGNYGAVDSIPFAILHNVYYYFGIYAVKKRSFSCLSSLLTQKIGWEIDNEVDVEVVEIWNMPFIYAPAIHRDAAAMFDRLRDKYAESKSINSIIGLDYDEFLTFACQFNMLFAFKAMQLQETQDDYVWLYPNFGRFYARRVTPLVSRIKRSEDYKKFIEDSFGETIVIFNEKANLRLEILKERGIGSRRLWDSVKAVEFI